MVNISKIKIHNFGRIKDLKYKFDRPGLNVIKGQNGYGKTTIINALFWCLHGKSLKKGSSVGTWQIMRTKDYDGTYIELILKVKGNNYTIYRCQDYRGRINGVVGKNSIFIKKGDNFIDTLRDKRDAEKFIINLIGYSPELFTSTALFGQKLKRVIQYDGPKKKEVFEEAFGATFLSNAKDLALTEKTQLEKEYTKIKTLCEKAEWDYNKIKEEILTAQEFIESWENDRDKTIKKLRKEIETLREEAKDLLKLDIKKVDTKVLYEALNKALEKYDPTIEKRLNTSIKNLVTLNNKANKILKELHELDNKNKNLSKCSYCGSVLKGKTQKKYEAVLKETKEKLNKEINHLREEEQKERENKDKLELGMLDQTKFKDKINDIKTKIKSLEEQKELYQNSKDRWDKIQYMIESNNNRIIEEENKELNLNESIGDLVKKRKRAFKVLKKYREELKPLSKELKTLEWVLKDALSNKGLKSFIFDSMLKLVNHNLKRYNPLIGFDVKMGIDLESARKDFYISIQKEEMVILYEDLSGGEQQLVDVAIALALHDVLESDKGINILLMDEVFESLDQYNVEKVADLLMQKATGGKSIHLITHHSTFNPINSYKIILGIDKQGFTEIKTKIQDS